MWVKWCTVERFFVALAH